MEGDTALPSNRSSVHVPSHKHTAIYSSLESAETTVVAKDSEGSLKTDKTTSLKVDPTKSEKDAVLAKDTSTSTLDEANKISPETYANETHAKKKFRILSYNAFLLPHKICHNKNTRDFSCA